MGKYIITFEDYPQIEEDGVKFYSCNEAPWWYASEQIISKLTPYTEPDMEKVNAEKDKIYDEARARGYDEGRARGYQEGLFDAWDAARKIVLSREDGGLFGYEERKAVFGCGNYMALKTFLAPEAIEKIRQWEDKKIFKPGNEVVSTCGVGIVTKVTRTGVELFHKDGSTGYDKFEAVKKTGRHFPEFVELLAKMKGESNDPD